MAGLRDSNILVTRPVPQANDLALLIEQQKGHAVIFPTLAIEPLKDVISVEKRLENIACYQWLVFISANAVNFAHQANKGKIENFKRLKIAAIGKATTKALKNKGLSVDLTPDSGFNSEALLKRPILHAIKGQRFLIIRGQGGRETLANTLKQRGAIVDYLEVYRRVKPKSTDDSEVVSLLNQKKLTAITITSGEALNNLIALLAGRIIETRLLEVPLIVISVRLKEMAIKLGFRDVLVSASPANTAIIKTVITVCNGEDCGRKSN
ncbi:MAG: uroporphyrinogen-III synthase [Methylococcales bacterium]|nr:uroporphyrinogen-III synthase [Methylococcales bacterium]